MIKNILLSLILVAGLTCLAKAQDAPPDQNGPGNGRGLGQARGDGQRGDGQRGNNGRGLFNQLPSFEEMDKNKDKKISRDEFPGPPQFFDRIDENHDGFIDEAEYKKFRERIANGGSQRLSEMMLKYLDTDHDGKISRAEFTAIMQIFDSLDKDHDGFLSQEELGRFFQVLNDVKVASTGGVEVDNLFAKFDKNKDGKITPDEMNNERTFKALDLNNDGQITREEAEQALKQLAERSRQKQQAEKK